MPKAISFFLAGLILVVACGAAHSASRRPPKGFVYYHFNGQAFVAGMPAAGGPFVAVGGRLQPRVETGPEKIEEVGLEPGKGAIAGICYIQNSGGKLASAAGYTPCRRTALRISGNEAKPTAVMTDDEGYFVAMLDPGLYRIGDAPLWVEVRVEEGQTTLVPLRAGKRMVD